MIPYRKFSDTFKNGDYAPAPPNPPKAPKEIEARAANVPTLDGLGALGDLTVEARNPAAPSDAELIAPSDWVQRVAPLTEGEPGFEEPDAARRGRVEEREGLLLHFCVECGAWGAFGYGVNLRAGRFGRWYCGEHRPSTRTISRDENLTDERAE